MQRCKELNEYPTEGEIWQFTSLGKLLTIYAVSIPKGIEFCFRSPRERLRQADILKAIPRKLGRQQN